MPDTSQLTLLDKVMELKDGVAAAALVGSPRGSNPLRRPDQHAKCFIYGRFGNDAKLTPYET
jgi:hypothetical protein